MSTEDVMAQAYQVIGVLANRAGALHEPQVQAALNYFNEGVYKEDFLPWNF